MKPLAFALSIGAGIVAAFAASEIAPTVHDANSLHRITERPVLGMVTLLISPAVARERRRNSYLFGGALATLVLSLIAVMAFAVVTSPAA